MDNETEIWARVGRVGGNVSVLTCVVCDELVRRTVTVPVTPSGQARNWPAVHSPYGRRSVTISSSTEHSMRPNLEMYW